MMKMTLVGGYKYRLRKLDGTHADYVLAGNHGNDTIWRADDGTEHPGSAVFQGVVDIEEIWRPDRAVNEKR
jgi:hypothetical protein